MPLSQSTQAFLGAFAPRVQAFVERQLAEQSAAFDAKLRDALAAQRAAFDQEKADAVAEAVKGMGAQVLQDDADTAQALSAALDAVVGPPDGVAGTAAAGDGA